MKKRIVVLMALMLTASLLFALAGCGGSPAPAAETEEPAEEAPAEEAAEEEPEATEEPAEEEPEATAEPTEEPAPTEEPEVLDIIGTETEGCYKVRVENLTGTVISNINCKPSGAAESAYVTLAGLKDSGDDRFDKEEASYLCVDPSTADGATAYDLQIIWKDWTVGELHGVPLDDMDKAEIHRAANSLPYLVYTSLSTGEQVDTSSMEQSTAEEMIANGTWAYGNGAPQQSTGGSSSGGGSTGGNSEGCITGALFN